MNSFQTLQADFQTALLQDQPLASGLLKPRGDAQFEVYRQAYRARLRSALRDNYEVLFLVMGDDAFDALAEAYIAAHPSTHYSLRWFGHLFASFMATHEVLVAHPAMVDLAHLEWALRHAFDAAHAEPLDATELAALPAQDWADLRLALHPSVQVLPLQWAVGPVWHALKSGQEEMPAPQALTHHVLVWREDLHTRWQSLTEVQTIFVQGLQAGHSFGDICATLAQQQGVEAAASAAVTVLRELLGNGVIASLTETASEHMA
jgi:hypothetical protein